MPQDTRTYDIGWDNGLTNRGMTLRPMGFPDRAYYQENPLPRPYISRFYEQRRGPYPAIDRDTNHWTKKGDQWANYKSPYMGGGGWGWGPR
jgi:hypothetical protein